MDRERILILVAVFASSQCATILSTKLMKYVQQAAHVFKLLYTSSCTGTENSIVILKNFSLYLIFLIKCLFNWLDLRNIFFSQLCDAVAYLCETIEFIDCYMWDTFLLINSELHHSSCYIFGIWLPMFFADTKDSIQNLIVSWSYSSGFGSFAVVFLVFIICLVLYFTFLITLVIIRLYKLFIKPLIKMLTTLLNYRRRFVLRSRHL